MKVKKYLSTLKIVFFLNLFLPVNLFIFKTQKKIFFLVFQHETIKVKMCVYSLRTATENLVGNINTLLKKIEKDRDFLPCHFKG